MTSSILRAVAAAPAPTLVWRDGDGALVRRVIAETGVSSTPARPGLGGYATALIEAAWRALARALTEAFSGAGGVVPLLPLATFLIIAAAAAALGVFVVRRIVSYGRRRSSASSGSRVEAAEAAPARRDAAAWRREVEIQLARGDVAGALEALWWWLAESLAGGIPVDSSWTTRDLLTRAARGDLGRVGLEIDALLYGPHRPAASEVSASLERFERALG